MRRVFEHRIETVRVLFVHLEKIDGIKIANDAGTSDFNLQKRKGKSISSVFNRSNRRRTLIEIQEQFHIHIEI